MLKSINSIKEKNLKILLRADLNLPLHEGKILDYTRLDALKPTIENLLSQNQKIAICSHLGRPKGQIDKKLSLKILIPFLEERLGIKVKFFEDILSKNLKKELESLKQNEIILLENIRFYKEEKENNNQFAQKISQQFDIFVNDAFGVSHRSHASNVAIAQQLESYAGLLMENEIKKLEKIKIGSNYKKPLTLIIGGAKMKTKTPIIKEYLNHAKHILIGGALANTFLKAQNLNIGKSLFEQEEILEAQKILELAKMSDTKIITPIDAKIKNLDTKEIENKDIDNINSNDCIYDIGEKTIIEFKKIIKNSKTIIFNGPVGLYIEKDFEFGTKEIFNSIKESKAESFLGGGDTVDALHDYEFKFEDFTHVSTGGGAMLTYLEGKKLPAVEVLKIK